MKFEECKIGDRIKYIGPNDIVFTKGNEYVIKSLYKKLQLIGLDCGMMDGEIFAFNPLLFEKISYNNK